MRYLSDRRTAKGRSNVEIRCKPERGPNDGFMQVVVRTRNGCGIVGGGALLADFGENYVVQTPLQSSPAKRFKGALDAWLAQHTSQAAVASCMGLPGSSGGGSLPDAGGKDGESEDAGDAALGCKPPKHSAPA